MIYLKKESDFRKIKAHFAFQIGYSISIYPPRVWTRVLVIKFFNTTVSTQNILEIKTGDYLNSIFFVRMIYFE